MLSGDTWAGQTWCIADIYVKIEDHEGMYIVWYLGFEREAYIERIIIVPLFFSSSLENMMQQSCRSFSPSSHTGSHRYLTSIGY